MYKQFTFYKRNGLYYVRFRNQNGDRLPGVSTGYKRKAEAEKFAISYVTSGKLDVKEPDSFANYASAFFDYDSSPYIQNEINRGHQYGRRYADENARIVKNILLPVWKEKRLSGITVAEIEVLLFNLLKKYSASRVISIRNVIACIFKEAYRLGVISINPMERVSKITPKYVEKGLYNDSMIDDLFADESIEKIWVGNKQHYCLNYLAYSTGMRQGELLALMPINIHEDFLRVEYSWERKYGLKEPKAKSYRCVPLTNKAKRLIKELIEEKGLCDSQFIFCGKDKAMPIDHRSINRRLNDALVRIGVSDEERRRLHLSFHSWRHVFTSKLRDKIPENKLKLLTGHKTDKMMDHYSHYDYSAVKDIRPLQESIFA